MAARIDTNRVENGLEITKLITNETNIVIPDKIDGVPVVSLGEAFLKDSYGGGNRTLVIPSSVVSASENALNNTSGLKTINYLGNFEVFNSFRWRIGANCQLICADGFSFNFLTDYPMYFPDFDEELLTIHQGISDETVMARLSNPVLLSDENREKYEAFMRSRVFPMTEHSIFENDIAGLKSVLDVDLLTENDLFRLLEISARSGRISSTSVLMSKLNSICKSE